MPPPAESRASPSGCGSAQRPRTSARPPPAAAVAVRARQRLGSTQWRAYRVSTKAVKTLAEPLRSWRPWFRGAFPLRVAQSRKPRSPRRGVLRAPRAQRQGRRPRTEARALGLGIAGRRSQLRRARPAASPSPHATADRAAPPSLALRGPRTHLPRAPAASLAPVPSPSLRRG